MPETPTAAVETHALCKNYGRKPVLRALSMRIPEGGIHAVIGRNGAGKSTLFQLLLGFLHPTSGHCSVLGTDSTRLTPAQRARIGWISEEHALPGWLRVEQLIALQEASFAGWQPRLCAEVLGQFDIPARQHVGALSRGERAGLALALALAQKPRLLILDEPMLGLDVVARQSFVESLLFADPEGSLGSSDDTGENGLQRTVVYCSHQLDDVERLADSVWLLDGGQNLLSATPDELCRRVVAWTASLPAGAAVPTGHGVLQARDLDGIQQFHVLDRGDDFAAELAALGATDVSRQAVSFEAAARALLGRTVDPTHSSFPSSPTV